MTVQLHRDSPLPLLERLPRLHDGQLFLDSPSPATRALVAFVWSLLERAYPEDDPRRVQFRIAPEEHFRRLTRVRRELLELPETRERLRELLREQGWPLERTWFDLLRLRAVLSGGHRNPAAAHAYLPHRDTWYANPPAQVNVWTAVSDVSEEQAFAFWPEHWERPIANDSAVFDYARWVEYGGWQVPDTRKRYPVVLEEPAGPELRVPARSGECLLFSGSHLHATRGHDAGTTRFSVEFRVVLQDDLEPQRLRRRLDNRSRGTTLPDFLRASDFVPLPPALAARPAGEPGPP